MSCCVFHAGPNPRLRTATDEIALRTASAEHQDASRALSIADVIACRLERIGQRKRRTR